MQQDWCATTMKTDELLLKPSSDSGSILDILFTMNSRTQLSKI